MSRRDFFRIAITQYFIIVTLINVAIFALGMIYRPDDRFGYEAFLTPLVYAAFSMIPVIFTYSKKEISTKRMFFRLILNLIAIEGIMIGIGITGSEGSEKQSMIIVSFALAVFVIFVLVMVISWVLDLRQAKQMNMDLENYKNRIQK